METKTALKTFLKRQFPSFDHHCEFLKIKTVIKPSILSLSVLRHSTEGYAKLMGGGALERERKIILKDISLSTEKYDRYSVGGGESKNIKDKILKNSTLRKAICIPVSISIRE